jgi:hypothetical protein
METVLFCERLATNLRRRLEIVNITYADFLSRLNWTPYVDPKSRGVCLDKQKALHRVGIAGVINAIGRCPVHGNPQRFTVGHREGVALDSIQDFCDFVGLASYTFRLVHSECTLVRRFSQSSG